MRGVATLGLDETNMPTDVLIYVLESDLERVMWGRQTGQFRTNQRCNVALRLEADNRVG